MNAARGICEYGSSRREPKCLALESSYLCPIGPSLLPHNFEKRDARFLPNLQFIFRISLEVKLVSRGVIFRASANIQIVKRFIQRIARNMKIESGIEQFSSLWISFIVSHRASSSLTYKNFLLFEVVSPRVGLRFEGARNYELEIIINFCLFFQGEELLVQSLRCPKNGGDCVGGGLLAQQFELAVNRYCGEGCSPKCHQCGEDRSAELKPITRLDVTISGGGSTGAREGPQGNACARRHCRIPMLGSVHLFVLPKSSVAAPARGLQ